MWPRPRPTPTPLCVSSLCDDWSFHACSRHSLSWGRGLFHFLSHRTEDLEKRVRAGSHPILKLWIVEFDWILSLYFGIYLFILSYSCTYAYDILSLNIGQLVNDKFHLIIPIYSRYWYSWEWFDSSSHWLVLEMLNGLIWPGTGLNCL